MLERLAGHKYYCFLDRFLGYFQIPIGLEDQGKTTFTFPYGTFAYKRMPFGLCNAPATLQCCMTAIFHELIEDIMEVFMDDFFIFASSFDHCLKNLEKMLKRCEETNLVLNCEKCHFMVKEGIVLGHKVSSSGIEWPIRRASWYHPNSEKKSLKLGSTGEISFATYVVSKGMRNGAINLYDEDRNEFIVNMQRVKPYKKDVLDTNRDEDITLEDEGEVTSLEVLRKFHWMILGGRFNQLSHVSSPLLSKPGEY
uniref:RNA-directed DNA polymerase homolog n=1 Tax=Tanacetum cinerariifolium TaxID=118510 RepID=A0A6L2MHB6_TANCI|nr:RNA-directed DNA polymerase homolog [Tanacetum cinerariifolium]